ncbi:hypothetical protein F5B18DRAFT_351041 [Nemania serpens]|nr:hypothetical protein F5B18DRAFT_351041 [Nemania serpens]
MTENEYQILLEAPTRLRPGISLSRPKSRNFELPGSYNASNKPIYQLINFAFGCNLQSAHLLSRTAASCRLGIQPSLGGRRESCLACDGSSGGCYVGGTTAARVERVLSFRMASGSSIYSPLLERQTLSLCSLNQATFATYIDGIRRCAVPHQWSYICSIWGNSRYQSWLVRHCRYMAICIHIGAFCGRACFTTHLEIEIVWLG